MKGQTEYLQNIFEYPKKIRTLADQYARRIIQKQSIVIVPEKKRSPDYATVDLNSINNETPRLPALSMLFMKLLNFLKLIKSLSILV